MAQALGHMQSQSVEREIAELEGRLEDAKARLKSTGSGSLPLVAPETAISTSKGTLMDIRNLDGRSSHHFLLLLADSALPLGSFAFSSGLESYLAHTRPASSFEDFLTLSVSSYASTTLPFVLAAHRNPHDLVYLNDCLDCAIMCTVGRRASVAQGRALLSIWDRSFRHNIALGSSYQGLEVLTHFTTLLRSTPLTGLASVEDCPNASAHLAPLFGVVARVLGLELQLTGYIFMLNHVKSLLSAAVRASIFGPYQAQKLLASVNVQDVISHSIELEWNTNVEDTGQRVPVMDLWFGRHEMLYSRIFNS